MFEVVCELVEAFRRCLDVVIGGRERSFLTGSKSVAGLAFARRPERDLCKLSEVGLLTLDRERGGRREATLVVLAELEGRVVEMLLLAVGFTGSRLGD
jgi:hypothetical protein